MNDPARGTEQLDEKSVRGGLDFSGDRASQLHHVIEKLRENYSFFSDMQEDEMTEFLAKCKQVTCHKDERLFGEGDIADNFFLILSGEIAVVIGGHEVARMRSGQIFGEMALLEHIPRTASAFATEKTVLFGIPAEAVSTAMPSLALKLVINIARQMSEKLRESNAHSPTY